MASFSLTDLGSRTAELLQAAFRGPVDITSRGKRKFVLLTTEEDWLVGAADIGKAFHADDAPDAVATMMLTALTAWDSGR